LIKSEHPIDPAKEWGAKSFSSEQLEVGTETYQGAHGHDMARRTAAQMAGDDKWKAKQYGYLDVGSTALLRSAQIALGYGELVDTIPAPQDKKNLWPDLSGNREE
jgi:hypothetical protein